MGVRRVPFNVLVKDQLTVFDEDGVTKRSGLPASNFTATVFLDNVEQPLILVTVAEIGTTGEYAVTWTPNVTGFWVVEVVSAVNNGVFRGEYDVVDPVTASDIGVPGQLFHGVVRDTHGSGVAHVDVKVLVANTSTELFTTKTEFDGSYEIPLTGQLNQNILVDLAFSGGGIQAFTKQSVRLI